MKNPFKTNFETQKYRLQRRSKSIVIELLRTALLLCAIVVISAVLIYGYMFTISSPYFQIKEITVRGCKELTEKEILFLAAIKPDQSLLAVNLDKVARRIEVNPWIKKVFLGRELPNRLIIEVRERQPVALIKRDNGFSLLDIDGIAFKKLEKNDELNVPVLNVMHGESGGSKLFAKSLELLRHLITSQDFPTIKNISEIHGHDVFGFSLFTDSGLCIRLGFDSYENKLKRLNPVMADLVKRNLTLRYLLIDLNDPAKITVQKKEIFGPKMPIGSNKGYRT